MRTTINLDDDIHELASIYAAARDMTLGAAISELARHSLVPPPPLRIAIADNGLPISLGLLCSGEESIMMRSEITLAAPSFRR